MIKKLAHFLSFSVAATICTFVLQVVATHVLTPEEFGGFAKWLTDINYFSVFLIFGLDNAILFFSKEKNQFLSNAVRNAILFMVVFMSACFLTWVFDRRLAYYIPLFISILSFSLYQTFNAFNQHSERMRLYGLFILIRAMALLVPFLYAFLMGDFWSTNDAIFAYSAVSVILAVGMAFVLFKAAGDVAFPKSIFDALYIAYGAKSMFNTLLAISLYTATIYCLDYLVSDEMLAYFFVAAAISKLAWVVPDAVGNILYPKFLRIGREYRQEDVLAETYFYAQLVFVINFGAVVVFAIAGKLVINLVFSSEYDAAYLPALILMIGNQGMVFYKILSRYLAAKNEWSTLRLGLMVGVLTNVCLNFYLIPILGVTGAAIATAIAFWACGLVLCAVVPGSFVGFVNVKAFSATAIPRLSSK